MGEPNKLRQWQIDEQKPEKHIGAAQESLWVAMNGSGNTPMVCFANACLLYTSPSPRDRTRSRMPSSA